MLFKKRSSAKEDSENKLKVFYDHDIRYRQPPFWSRLLILSIIGSVGFGIVYACIARIDEVIIARGELQALGSEKLIKAPITGVVRDISVREGQAVKKDQLLIQFDKEVL